MLTHIIVISSLPLSRSLNLFSMMQYIIYYDFLTHQFSIIIILKGFYNLMMKRVNFYIDFVFTIYLILQRFDDSHRGLIIINFDRDDGHLASNKNQLPVGKITYIFANMVSHNFANTRNRILLMSVSQVNTSRVTDQHPVYFFRDMFLETMVSSSSQHSRPRRYPVIM